jgi:hypothetical protein
MNSGARYYTSFVSTLTTKFQVVTYVRTQSLAPEPVSKDFQSQWQTRYPRRSGGRRGGQSSRRDYCSASDDPGWYLRLPCCHGCCRHLLETRAQWTTEREKGSRHHFPDQGQDLHQAASYGPQIDDVSQTVAALVAENASSAGFKLRTGSSTNLHSSIDLGLDCKRYMSHRHPHVCD